ncbi:uncharacterized protein LOC143933261 [Lithobates pipiens]
MFKQMPGPNNDFTDADECCDTDELSDDEEPFHEAWVASEKNYFDEGSTEEDYNDLHTNANPSHPYSPFHYEEEDWDAEVLQNENPYDEEDLVDMSCELISPTIDTLINESSYLPSLHHVAPVIFSDACNALHVNYEAGQFEDAEL